ncbi:MAG: 4-hydroxythreonine-4-phosphate dehydrogenase PdxA [Acidobacteriota bacterium]|nr:4-hydroxythreonine-4-phosphate dehydrogenase PdxA [Acidobacteriota bacterium]
MKQEKPTDSFPVVFSMGDPHGVGPEVILKALQPSLSSLNIRPIIFGDAQYLKGLAGDLGLNSLLYHVKIITVDSYEYPPSWGTLTAQAGHFALRCLEDATAYCRENDLPLLVTGPVNKQAIHLAGSTSPGQTELVASFFPDSDPAMAFFSDQMMLLLATTHIPLKNIPSTLNKDDLVRKTEIFLKALRQIGIAHPRLALCALNPHASEEGLFGTEESTILEPAIGILCKKHGENTISGPFPSDTLFRKVLENQFDGVVALYHDQGLIPLKLVAFESAVNVTLGLPLIRTSPDHGTAFEIAGSGVANSQSMEAAIRWGIRLVSP